MSGTHTYISGPPLSRLYARALLRSLPDLGWLPGGHRSPGDRLPQFAVRRVGVSTDPDHLAAYARLTGQWTSTRLPGLYPHLSALGAQLAVLTDPGFPFAALGLVHVANSVTQHRPLLAGDTYDLVVRAARLRPHRRGRLVDIETTATVGGEPVWEETSTALARGGGDPAASERTPLAGLTTPVGDTWWRVPGNTGRAYARLSADVNPIHLSAVTAKLFGFPRAIAHGMWTAARALAAAAPTLPDAYRYDVDFRRPVLLPAQLRFGTAPAPDGSRRLGVVSGDGGTTHLVGVLRTA